MTPLKGESPHRPTYVNLRPLRGEGTSPLFACEHEILGKDCIQKTAPADQGSTLYKEPRLLEQFKHPKWDGFRALVTVDSAVRLHSRHGHDHTTAFPELGFLEAFATRSRLVLDGELVVLDPDTGKPRFDLLMARTRAGLPSLAARERPATFMVFDVMEVDGTDLCGYPWTVRRALLEELHTVAPDGPWRVNTAFEDGPGLLAATADLGMEGVVAKRMTSRYLPGRRSQSWRKVKHRTVEWFDLVGWRPPQGRDVGGLVAAEDGRVVGVAFPALPSRERERLAALVAEYGKEVGWGIELPAGVAEIEVGYLERMPGSRLREPVGRAVRIR